MIAFGKYDRRCKFKSLGSESDGFGGFVPIESVVLSTFCRVIQVNASDNIEQAQLGLPRTYKIGVQYRKNFNPSVNHVLNYDGFNHQITAVELKDERQRREWVITMIRNEH